MNKHRFTGIIILMGISLFGIIGVQIFWIQNAMSVAQKQFDQQASQALLRAAYRIERNQNAYYISSMVARQSKLWGVPQNMIQASGKKDSLVNAFGNYWKGESDDTKNVILEHHNEKTITIHENGLQTISYDFDTVINDGFTKQRIKTYSSVTSSTGTGSKKLKHDSISEVSGIKQQLDDVMNQMILEFTFKDIPMEERLGYKALAPIIKQELKNSRIPLNFEYAITDYWGNIFTKLSSKNFDVRRLKETYSSNLFPNKIGIYTEQIKLYFPEKIGFIFNSILWLFLGSIIFTFIILITFWYTLRVIYNQKKISEIKSDFISNMTHEFKTPIATISLATDQIANPIILNNPDKVSRFTQIIKEENHRMNRQVESVLKMSLIDKKDFNLNMSNINVHPLIDKTIKNISIQIEQKGGKITMGSIAENDLVKVDETHFTNIIFNLLDNANKYSLNAPPKIEISTYNNDDDFFINISDQGIGMDKDTLDKIFEKFYRVPTGNIHTVKGFGLGLSYVKAIAMQFNGNISVVSKKDKGSTFKIRIPLVKE